VAGISRPILGTFADFLHRWSRPKLYIGRDKATLTGRLQHLSHWFWGIKLGTGQKCFFNQPAGAVLAPGNPAEFSGEYLIALPDMIAPFDILIQCCPVY